MATNLNPEEAEALREVAGTNEPATKSSSVELRNFAEPRRLSRERLQRLAKIIIPKLQGVGTTLAQPLRQFHKLSLISVSEVNVTNLFDGFESPFTVMVFRSQGAPGWLVWNPSSAVALTETILAGGMSGELRERALSLAECRVVERVLMDIAVPIVSPLGFEIKEPMIAQEIEQLTTLEDAGPDADSQRLLIHLTFDGPGGTSDLQIFVPGLEPDDDHGENVDCSVIPEHLDEVPVLAHAYLGSVDVPLNELLELEVGDVLPLGIEVDSPISLYLEDRAIAKARWGQHKGNLTAQLLEVAAHPGEINQPTVQPEDPTRNPKS